MVYLWAIVVICLIVLAHEFGHYLAARSAGIEVQEFAIGFGPKIVGFRGKEQRFTVPGHDPEVIVTPGTEYNLRLLPLGGFVRMTGMEDGDENNPIGFNTKRPFWKMVVSAAGPVFNVLFAVLVFVSLYTFIGVPAGVQEPIIGVVNLGSPAEKAGIKPGDRVIAIDGHSVKLWEEVSKRIARNPEGQAMQLTILRQDKERKITVTPEYNKTMERALIGISVKIFYKQVGAIQGIKDGFTESYLWTVQTFRSLIGMIAGQYSLNEMSGPVGIGKLIGDTARQEWIGVFRLTAILSINLGLINLLPIPALDGSRIVFGALEAIRRRPVEPDTENFIHMVGFVFLMGLILLITFHDIYRIIQTSIKVG